MNMAKSKTPSKLASSRTTAAKKQPPKHMKPSTRPASNAKTPVKKTAPVSQNEPQLEEVLRIIKLMSSTDLAELELETTELKISLKRGSPDPVIQMIQAPQGMMTAPMIPAQRSVAGGNPGRGAVSSAVPEPAKIEYQKIVSPMAGTFYRAPSPSAPPYVKEGDLIKVGQPVCIIEAMKLMNEIKADKAGKIVKIPFENAQPLEKGAALFLIDPNG